MNAHSPIERSYIVEMSEDGFVTIPEIIRKKAGLVPGAQVSVGINDRGEAVILSRMQAKRAGETSDQRHDRIRKALDRLTGAHSTGQSTDAVMDELRGDRKP